jgi:hypothetical protein
MHRGAAGTRNALDPVTPRLGVTAVRVDDDRNRLVNLSDLVARRLANQRLTGAGHRRPADVVSWCGAVQAQEYEPARWGLGLRMVDDAADAAVARAFDQGRILRTHLMRPTWHFVTPADIGWLLALTAPRVKRVLASYLRSVELDAPTLARATTIVERALGDRQHLTRVELGERLQRAGLPMQGLRLVFLTLHAELEGVVCSGPRRGRQFTYALLAERAPRQRTLERDEALAELTRRFFRSHGPASIRDFVWWSGLLTADAKRGLDINRARREDVDGLTYWSVDSPSSASARADRVLLLPIYDEYLVAYRDRLAVPHGPSVIASPSGRSVRFQHALVIDGQVAGTWRMARDGRGLTVAVTAMRRLSRREQRELSATAERYGRFKGSSIELRVD